MLSSIALLQIVKTFKLMLMHGGRSQTNLLDTICDLKNEMQANAALSAAVEKKEGIMAAGLQAINIHFQMYKSVNGVPAPQTQTPISTSYKCTIWIML